MTSGDLTTVLVNAVVTIITTVIVTRITLNNGSFASSAALQSIARRYSKVLLDLVFLAVTGYFLWSFLSSNGPINRWHVVFMPLHTINFLAFLLFTALDIRSARRAASA